MKRLVLLALLLPAPVRAQISPGELSRPHATLEGNTHCLKCHDARQGVSAEKCLACHTALGAQVQAGRGLHARPDHRDCKACHVEHHGPEFELVYWGKPGRASFDHALTGFTLVGRHRALDCQACHQPKFQKLAPGGAGNPARSFLGLSTACVACHQDVHKGRFAGRDCIACHSQDRFKPVLAFDHALAGFPLQGRHQALECPACHQARFQKLAGTEAADPARAFLGLGTTCTSCHEDVHRGRFAGRECTACHSTDGFKPVSSFDHAVTGFPLTGRHQAVKCEGCHKPGAGGRSTYAGTPKDCASCHRDPHERRLGAACATCHDTGSWQRADRKGFDHEKTRYPLRGRHQRVACEGCHRPGQPLQPRHDRCAACHADSHQGQFAARADRGACESCHDVNGFLPARFGPDEHGASKYPLEGAHLAVPCDACHKPLPGAARRLLQFRLPARRCAECHRDVHQGEVKAQVERGGCETCHRVESWRSTGFDHAATRFPLQGAHQRPACRDCHKPVDVGTPRQRVQFAGVPLGCEGCHRDPHAGQLRPCERCHAATTWRELRFDHARDTAFSLAGAHVRLACSACHRPETVDGKTSVRYKPLPTTCRGCHGGAR